MADDLASLLKKKSPGTTFGDMAYAYMTGRKKNDKKERRKQNLLLGLGAIYLILKLKVGLIIQITKQKILTL